MPRISSPYATLSITRRCGSRPKCWNTIENLRLRRSRSLPASAVRMSSPSNVTAPEVGSISRVRQRTSVDLPEPDRPITTNISPGATSKLTSRTAAVQPVRSISSRLLNAQQLRRARHLLGLRTEDLPQVRSPRSQARSSLVVCRSAVAVTVRVVADLRHLPHPAPSV